MVTRQEEKEKRRQQRLDREEKLAEANKGGFISGFIDLIVMMTAFVFVMSIVLIIVLACIAVPVALIAIVGDLVGFWDASL